MQTHEMPQNPFNPSPRNKSQVCTNNPGTLITKRNKLPPQVRSRWENSRVFLLVTRRQCLAEIGVGTEVQRSLSLLVFQLEIGAVRGQEAGDEGAALLILALRPQTH